MVDCISQALTPCEGVGAKDYTLGLLERVFGKVLKLVCVEHAPGSAACKAVPRLPPLGAQDLRIENYVELFAEAAATIEDSRHHIYSCVSCSALNISSRCS
ncbi:hypothetical protein V5799_027594 [Amblyomma americanum]|uniref:Uncharacterized protein n=1 Tax=Amblyomma americanum TaxID=6943 RepID=A0AAQ4DF99_AMBAM